VRDENIILNVISNIFIESYLKFEGNNVSVLISDSPLSPMLQSAGFSVLDSCWFCCFLVKLNVVESPFYALLSQYYSGQMLSSGFSLFEKT